MRAKDRTVVFILSCAVVCTGLALLSSCKKDSKAETVDLYRSYFPDWTGHYVDYQVDSIIKNDVNPALDTVYQEQVRELIQSVFYDNSNRPTLRIERYKKKYDSTVPYSQIPWTLSDVWTANVTTTTAEKKEENQTFLKLVFPVNADQKWNGNSYNTMPSWDYRITSAHLPETINSLHFDSVATVTQTGANDLVEANHGMEKYAKNVGMIYKEVVMLQVQPKDINDIPPYDDTISVQYYRMKVIAYGNLW